MLDRLYRGGTEMQALDVCRNAGRNGLDLSVASGGGALEGEFRDSGVQYHSFRRRAPLDLFLVHRLRQLIKGNHYNIVHTHQAVDALHAYLAARGTEAKCVVSYQGDFHDSRNRRVLEYLIPRVGANIACSKGMRSWLAEQGLDSSGFKVIYNGVDEKRLTYQGPDLREELDLDQDTLLFGMVAHFYPGQRKDQMTLCEAFTRVARDMPEAHLILVGRVVAGAEAKYAECLRTVTEAGLASRVHFLGQRSDLAKIVESLDIYVFSSLQEGLPIALMEAMLSHKPTILSDIEPHLEVSCNGEYALTFSTGNADDLALRMTELARDPDKRRMIADRASTFAKRTFSIDAHIANLQHVYASVLGEAL